MTTVKGSYRLLNGNIMCPVAGYQDEKGNYVTTKYKEVEKTSPMPTDEARDLFQKIKQWTDPDCPDDWLLRELQQAITRARNDALESACAVVYGQCSSDNVAQRTVESIRALKRIKD